MLFFTGRAFIVIRHILKLVLQFQFDLQSPLKQPKMLIFEKWKNMVLGPNYGIFWPKGDLKPCIWVTYTVCLWFQSLLETFFFKFSKNCTFWAKLIRGKMAWTILPRSAHFFRFKNWCKITSRKKSSLTSARSCAEQWVKLPFLSKKCIFRAEKGIFSKSSFYTKMFNDPKYSFSVSQK